MMLKKAAPHIITILLLYLLVYTRFVNLSWGLPYPFHPDERNMADAIMRLGCPDKPLFFQFSNCFDPHFYAYGQFALYAGYLIAVVSSVIKGEGQVINFYQAVMALRMISAMSSIGLFFTMRGIFRVAGPKKIGKLGFLATQLLFIFSPVLIQFSHFGTTESVLMLVYTLTVYISLLYLNKTVSSPRFILLSGVITGIAVGIKVSSIAFALLPLMVTALSIKKNTTIIRKIVKKTVLLISFVVIAGIFAVASSPYSIINFNEFRGSMDYEAGVARGLMKVFYTRQFEETTPVLFQIRSSFPYAMGAVAFMLFGAGFFASGYRKKNINILRVAFLVAFLPASFLYAKWTRFIAPAYPIAILIGAIYFDDQLGHILDFARRHKRRSVPFVALTALIFLFIYAILPGMAYLSIYKMPDVRYAASEWIYKNIPQESLILSETANVVDMPIQPPGGFGDRSVEPRSYRYISFNSYDADSDIFLYQQLNQHLATSDYIFVPSRRVFMNHTCLNEYGHRERRLLPYEELRCRRLEYKYPVLNSYYKNLFTGQSGFTKIAEFTSYPRIELFGFKLVEFPDETAEETWTVFDHPVVRIYGRSS